MKGLKISENAKRILIVFALVFAVCFVCKIAFDFTEKTEMNSINNPEMAKTLTYAEVKPEDAKIENCDFVQFSSFFAKDLNEDGNAERLSGTCKNINNSDILYMELKVLSKGYLKNGKIEIVGNNFYLNTAIVADKTIAKNYIENNTKEIQLVDQVQNGTQKMIEAQVIPNIKNINDYSANNTVKLTGVYVYEDENGQEVEVPIEKECTLTVDWYGTTSNKINTPTGMVFSNSNIVNEETGNIELAFSVETLENSTNRLLLDSNVVTVTIPEVKGLKAVNAKVTNDNVSYEFDKENGKLIITRKSKVDENGNILTSMSYKNYYDIIIEYPSEIYNEIERDTIIINVPVESYYTAYNNPSAEFNNEIANNIAKSNVASKRLAITYEKPFGDVYKFDVEIGELVKYPYNKYIVSKKEVMKTYNNSENELKDIYEVRWIFTRGASGKISKAEMNYILKDEVNKIDSMAESEVLENTTNIGIYIEGADTMLGANGYVLVYNADNNELLHKFTSEDWNNYTKNEPYYYSESVENVKVEISESANNTTLIVHHVKEIDNKAVTTKYTKEQFEKLSLVYTNLTGSVYNENNEFIGSQNVSEVAAYEDEVSVAKILVQDDKIPTNEETVNAEMQIAVSTVAYNQSKWKNAEFLVEMPADILNMEINSVVTYNENIKIKAYDLYKQDGKYFIKIITTNDVADIYTIFIDYNITPNTKMPTTTKQVTLYAYNAEYDNYENNTQDIYDVNNNTNIKESVGISQDEIQFIAPTGLITSQYVIDYDDEQDNEMTEAPNVAEVKKEQRNAQINVNLLNNYSSTISNIKLIGQIPFQGNSYIITGKDLGSQFDTLLTGEVEFLSAQNFENEFTTEQLNDLKNNLKIYYSTLENPNKDLEDKSNNWVLAENVTDWSEIKTYLIDFEYFVMNYGDDITFKYVVSIPEGIEYEKVSYSQHAVYFNLDTPEGKLATYTEPNKLGIRITRKFNLELQKNIVGTNTPINNALYLLESGNPDEENYESYLQLTDSNGKINIENLNVGKVYKLTEIKSEDDYEVNNSTLEFIIQENENTEELEVQIISNGAGYKESAVESNTVNITVEDKVRYDLKLLKTRTGTDTKISNITYLITAGEENTANYEIYRKVTNENGEINLDNLYLNKIYTIEEIYTTSNYELATGKLQFKVVQDDTTGKLTLEVVENGAGYKNHTINQDNYTVSLNMEDEVRYSVILNKKDESSNSLSGIEFKIQGKNLEQVELTNTDGNIEFTKLSLNETYTITELKADGYYINEPFEICVTKDENGKLTSNIGSISDDGNKVELNINVINEKIPTYNLKLIKVENGNKDKKLSNVTFKIEGPNYSKELVTNENGEISINDLFKYVEGKNLEAIYTIQEIIPAEGYVIHSEPLKIQVSDNNGELKVNVIEGQDFIADTDNGKDIEINSSTVTITLENVPTFKISKIDKSSGTALANVKFAIYKVVYNEDGTINSIEPAKDGNGEIIGELQTINGKEYYVVTTNEQGEIAANLVEGLYYIEELQTAEGYVLPNENERIHYFGIGEYKEKVDDFGFYWENAASTGTSQFTEIKQLKNGYIVGGYSLADMTIETIDGSNQTIAAYLPFIAKFDLNGKCLWVKALTNTDTISNLEVTVDNEILILQSMNISKYDESGKYVDEISLYDVLGRTHNSISINNSIVKVDNEYLVAGEIETDSTTDTVATKNNGSKLISSGKFILVFNESLEVINYYNEQEEEYETKLNKYNMQIIKNNNYVEQQILTSSTTVTTQLQGNVELIGSSIIIYNENGNYEWAISTNNEKMRFVIGSKLSDGSIFVVTEQAEDLTFKVNNTEYNLTQGISVIKFNNSGEIVWVKNGYGPMYFENSIVDENNNMVVVGYELNQSNETVGTIKCIKEYQISPEFPNIQEIVIENKKQEYKITTEVKQGKGTISGENEEPYEIVVHKEDSKLPIKIVPDTANGWEIKRITINGEIIEFVPNADGTVTLPQFIEMTEHKHIAVWFVNPNMNYNMEVTKTNENGELLANAKFTLQKIVKDGNQNETLYDAVDEEGNYVGYEYDLNGKTYRVVESDENGIIRALLPYGNYRLTEIEAPYGHNISEENTYDFSIGIRGIYYIEDLLEFGNDVTLGNGYSAELLRTIDFEDDASYKNPEDTSWGDYNGDGTVEGIKLELTNTAGSGFVPIGNENNPFKNLFEGNSFEIKNIYCNSTDRAGLFAYTDGANILNLGMQGGKISGTRASGIIANADNTTIANCYNNVEIEASGNGAAGIIGYATGNINIYNCYNLGNIKGNGWAGGIIGYIGQSNIGNIYNCYNEGNISATLNYAGGIVGYCNSSSAIITGCYNKGIITGSSYIAGISGYAGSAIVTACYNNGRVVSSNSNVAGIVGIGVYVFDSVNTGLINSGNGSAITGSTRIHSTAVNYYYSASAANAYSGSEDGVKSLSYLQSKEIVAMLNENMDTDMAIWEYKENDYPELVLYNVDIKDIENAQIIDNSSVQKTFVNNRKEYQITTEILENTEGKRNGGTITGKDSDVANIKFVETVKYNEDSTINIQMKPNEYYKIEKILINNEEQEFTVNENGTVTLNTFKNVDKDIHIQVQFERANTFTLLKKNEDGDILPGTKFAIYKLEKDGENIVETTALDKNGNIVGTLEEINGEQIYVVTSDENGMITANLPKGEYRIKEVQAASGYLNENWEKDFVITFADLKVNSTTSDSCPTWGKSVTPTSDNGLIKYSGNIVYKYNCDNEEEWNITLSKAGYLGLFAIEEMHNEEYYVGGFLGGSITVDKDNFENPIEDVTITSTVENGTNAIMFVLNSEGKIKRIEKVGTGNGNYVYGIMKQKDGSYIVVYSGATEFSADETVSGEVLQLSSGIHMLHYTAEGKIQNSFSISVNSGVDIVYQNEVYIVTVITQFIEVYKYNYNGELISQSESIGVSNTSIYDVYEEKDGRKFKVGYIYNTTIPGDLTENGEEVVITEVSPRPAIFCYNKDGKISKIVKFDCFGMYYNIDKLANGEYIAVGYASGAINEQFNEHTYIDETTGEKALIVQFNENGEILGINTNSNAKKYIVLEVENTNVIAYNRNGGGYLLANQYKIADTIDPITLELENKKAAKIIIHHYLKNPDGTKTTIQVAEDEIKEDLIGAEYTTSPKTDLKDVELEKDQNGIYIIPSNATGNYTPEVQEITYYYEPKDIKLTVHHYLEGTETKLAEDETNTFESEVKVDVNEGTYEIITEGEHDSDNNENYKKLIKNYKFTNISSDAKEEMTIETDLTISKDTEVTYTYKTIKHQITTRVEIPEGQANKGGTISGEDEKPYETVEHGEDSKQPLIITPDEGYRINKITINKIVDGVVTSQEVVFTPDENGNYELQKFENVTNDYEIVVQFVPNIGKVIVHHYIEGTTIQIAPNEITQDKIGTLVKTKPVDTSKYNLVEDSEKYILVGSPETPDVNITTDLLELTYYYQAQYKITTDVIPHNEKQSDGTVQEIKGGTISGEDLAPYEEVLKGNNSKEEIKVTPDEGFIITGIKINGLVYDFEDKVLEDGSVILEKFENMNEDKHIEVEFRRITKVIVQHILKNEDGTIDRIYSEEVIDGYVGKDYDTQRINITNYLESEDEQGNLVPENKDGLMEVDTIYVKYYYEKATSGIIVKHIEKVQNKELIETIDPETGDTITQEKITYTPVKIDGIEDEYIPGLAGENEDTSRKEIEGYVSASPIEDLSGSDNVINVKIDEDNVTVTYVQDKVIEVIYWYEKQYQITTNVIEHTEKVENSETGKVEEILVKGGTISGEDEQPYEKVLRGRDNIKQIKIVPDDGYRIKYVTIKDGNNNAEKVYITPFLQEDGKTAIIPEKYFENMQADKHIEVEFEKIPAKVIVKYIDAFTKEELLPEKYIEGFVNDEYSEEFIEIEEFIQVEPKPENEKGKMTENTIVIVYYYQKEYKITTDVIEHEELKEKGKIDLIVNKDDSSTDDLEENEDDKEEKILVKGGSISGEDELPYEIVLRGNNNAKVIEMKPEKGYRIKSAKIIDGEEEIELYIKNLVDKNGIIKLPESYFKNMQSDKHVIVEFEPIPVQVIAKYLEIDTEKQVSNSENGNGFIGDEYVTYIKNIELYELVEEKLPENAKGTANEEVIEVIYWYKKLPFNMKVTKEFASITVDGVESPIREDNKFAKLEIANTQLDKVDIQVIYKITVTNTEKVAGKALLEEKLPMGFVLSEESKNSWTQSDKLAYLLTKELQPGETVEYEIVLKWDNSSLCIGNLENVVKIVETDNLLDFEETTLEDNRDSCMLLLSIKTGEDRTVQTIMSITCFAIAGILFMYYIGTEIYYKKK